MSWTTDLKLDDPGELLPLGRVQSAQPGPAAPGVAAAGARAIRVAIADGQALVRAGFNALLAGEEDFTVVGEAGNGDEAVALAKHARPDVMLIDLTLPGLDGLDATRRILADPELVDVQVLILTTTERDDLLFGALRAGASGFLVKDTRPAELVRTVRAVASGDALLSPRATRRLIAEIASQPDPQRPSPEQLEELTAREREVMALVAAGMSNQEIAEQLVVSLATARTHVSRALRKVDARDRAQLVALAYETGLVQPRRHAVLQG
jgi:DNA-binding NarL/FixJ family response regulator